MSSVFNKNVLKYLNIYAFPFSFIFGLEGAPESVKLLGVAKCVEYDAGD